MSRIWEIFTTSVHSTYSEGVLAHIYATFFVEGPAFPEVILILDFSVKSILNRIDWLLFGNIKW